MVGHDSGYGILLTDDFGSPYYDDLVKAIKELREENDYDYDYPSWIMSFPSAEDDQLILGMSIVVYKKMNFVEIHEEWEKLMETIPNEITEILAKYNLDPDVHIVSGKY